MEGARPRRARWLAGGATAAVLVGGVALALAAPGSQSPQEVAQRWVDVHNRELEDCSVLDLYSDPYLEAQGFSRNHCEEDPDSFFTYWFMEAETANASYELGDVEVDGDQAVAEVHEVRGSVPHLRLLLVRTGGAWRIEAVGADLRSEA